MKKLLSLLMALVMLLSAASALAAGNVTVLVRGQNGFDDSVSGAFVLDGKLLLTTWDNLYIWDPDTKQAQTVQGYTELGDSYGSAYLDEPSPLAQALQLADNEQYYMMADIYSVNGHLYRLASIYSIEEDGDEYTETYRSAFVEICIDDTGKASLGEIIPMDDLLNIEYYEGGENVRSLESSCASGSILYALSYNYRDNVTEVLTIDLENVTVDAKQLDTEQEIRQMAPFSANQLLLVTVDYSTEATVPLLLLYNIDSEEITELGTLPSENWTVPGALCYDEARGQLYYALAGSVWRMQVTAEGLGEAVEFGDMPLSADNSSQGILLNDWYIVATYDGVVGRDVTQDKLPTQRLRVANGQYSDAITGAYYPFTDAHPEYIVTINNNWSTDTLLTDMLNRSSDTDIYTMSGANSAYSALISRGFLAELDGSSTLTEAVDSMYAFIRDFVSKDGHLYAVPLSAEPSSQLWINQTLLTEKLGIAAEEMPTTWPELFALLGKLADGRLTEVPEVSIFSPGETLADVRYFVAYMMLQDYFLWLDADEAHLDRAAEVLIENLQAFEQINWNGFGLPEEYEDSEAWEYNEENILFSQEGVGLNAYYAPTSVPCLLAITAGEEPLVGVTMSLAFVNPFSEHREEAIAYLEEAWNLISTTEKMQMIPTMNDPVENTYYQQTLDNYDANIASLEKLLEKAEDEEEKESLNQQLADMRTYRAEYETEYRYSISEETIARYRAFESKFTVSQSSIWGEDNWTVISQYLDGAITAQQVADQLVKTLQMRRLEGN